ncbi:uncharacterized protein CDAR_557951 [Caerostris darwini]|uniref:XK-related protein n=1 Tax=Caerostris darwini TaxID=1538125 RepID=A0AAV4P9L0_9ARAC|nr:uncharacterized protein CDAR_557951 [Caerostris darwini]
MVIDIKVNLPKIEKVKVSRVVLISGILTFLYLIEFSIGIRVVYHTFSLWSSSYYDSKNTQYVSWTLCVACLFVCATSCFCTNLMSAMWEQKQLKEKGKEKNVLRFAFHIIVGGMIWRYVCLWFSDKKDMQKKEALLLTMAKFHFTQFYTIPMIIVSASLLENFEEIIYDLCAVICISFTLLLTCIMFSWCKNETEELKKWNFETSSLVPLIFCHSSDEQPKSKSSKELESSEMETPEAKDGIMEIVFLRIIVLLQTFSFTFGRLLALGILLKIAGIYAISIMFLQLLISVVYLKFQVPFLVSDSLPKWRQLTRLAFMSYILIFEWHLNRDPKTAYDFTSNIKHSMLYYFIATLESIFYFITWAITESYTSNNYLDYIINPKRKFVRNLIIVGTMSLIFSLTIFFLLMFWQSRRLTKLLHSLQRRYLNSKLKMSSRRRSWMKRKSMEDSHHPKVDISNPIAINTVSGDISLKDERDNELSNHSSYRDLRDPVDDEIGIYEPNTLNNREHQAIPKMTINDIQHTEDKSIKSSFKSKRNNLNGVESNKEDFDYKSQREESDEEPVAESAFNAKVSYISPPAVIDVKENKSYVNIETAIHSKNSPSYESSKVNNALEKESNEIQDSTAPISKSKITAFSESINVGWNKFSSLSRKFTGAMQEHIQKRKEQFQNNRASEQDNKPEPKSPGTTSPEKTTPSNDENYVKETPESLKGDPDSSEGYFVGDSRYNKGEVYLSCQDITADSNESIESQQSEEESFKSASVVNLHEVANDSEPVHCEGTDPCPCYVCRTVGDGHTILRRRRSSSVPLPERKTRYNLSQKVFPKQLCVPSLITDSNSIQVDIKTEEEHLEESVEITPKISNVPRMYLKGSFQNLSIMSLDSRIEHYV